jgi:hypothetical protein
VISKIWCRKFLKLSGERAKIFKIHIYFEKYLKNNWIKDVGEITFRRIKHRR